MQAKQSQIPPAKTQRILRWEDLPHGSGPARFELTDAYGQTHTITLKQGNRRVLEGLMHGPMFCASPVRISDRVLILKRDYGVTIRTEVFDSDGTTECERFGVYFLEHAVRRVGFEEAA